MFIHQEQPQGPSLALFTPLTRKVVTLSWAGVLHGTTIYIPPLSVQEWERMVVGPQ